MCVFLQVVTVGCSTLPSRLIRCQLSHQPLHCLPIGCLQVFTEVSLILLLFGNVCGDFCLLADTGTIAVGAAPRAPAPRH